MIKLTPLILLTMFLSLGSAGALAGQAGSLAREQTMNMYENAAIERERLRIERAEADQARRSEKRYSYQRQDRPAKAGRGRHR